MLFVYPRRLFSLRSSPHVRETNPVPRSASCLSSSLGEHLCHRPCCSARTERCNMFTHFSMQCMFSPRGPNKPLLTLKSTSLIIGPSMIIFGLFFFTTTLKRRRLPKRLGVVGSIYSLGFSLSRARALLRTHPSRSIAFFVLHMMTILNQSAEQLASRSCTESSSRFTIQIKNTNLMIM